MNQEQVKKLIKNPYTKKLVDFVEMNSKITKTLLSPQFFHKSHNEMERVFICRVLEETMGCRVERVGKEGVKIDF